MMRVTRFACLAVALPFALALASFSTADEGGKARPKSLTGEVSKADAKGLTVVRRGDSGTSTEAFQLNAQTKITVQTSEDQTVKGEGGRDRIIPKTIAGQPTDLKTGQRVTVIYSENDIANEVLIHRQPKERKGER
jgi:hypothetical protein